MDAQTKPRHSTVLNRLYEFTQAINVAELLDDEELSRIGMTVCEEFGIDDRSREEWEATAKKAMDVALQVRKEKNYPFPGASNIKYPLVTVAALQFNARAYPAIMEGDKIVKATVVGNDNGVPQAGPDGQPVADPETGEPAWQIPPGAKREKADRISEHMSYQLTKQMPEWEEDTDTLLMQLPIIGCAFRKTYWDGVSKRPRSEMVSALDVVVNNAVSCLEDAPRITHKLMRYPHKIEERKRSGEWLDIDFSEAPNANGDKDAPHEFLEQHRLLDLDEDGYAEPYIVTVHKETQKVVRIVADYAEKDIEHDNKEVKRIDRKSYFTKYAFIPDPKGGFYDIGFGRLLESLGAAVDTTINQLIDAGHLQNAGGGFIGSGLRLKKSTLRVTPGVYTTVEASGGNIRDAIVPMQFPDPSAVLFNLLGLLIEAAKDITATKDILTGDSGGRAQTATTTLALIEQGMKVFTAIYKRVYRSLAREFDILFRLNAEHLDEESYFNVLDNPKAIARADYEVGAYDVCPVADPRVVTDMQRLTRAQAVLETLEMNPGAANEILRRYYTAIGVEDVDKLIVEAQPDPLQQAAAQAEVAGLAADVEQTEAETAKIIGETERENARLAMDAVETGARMAEPKEPAGAAA